MKKTLIIGCSLLMIGYAQAQQKEGRIVYERTAQIQMRFQGMGDELERMIPKSRVDKIEVLFGNNQSIRRILPDETPAEEPGGSEGGPGLRLNIIAAGADDILYNNFTEERSVDQRELATKKYLVGDSIRKLNWKLTGETKTILGYSCQQATTQRISSRTMMTMNNGQMKKDVIPDTANITAWFSPAIPISAGPEYQGQLPGLILAIDINNGRTVYKAIELSPKVDLASVREPRSGKKVTPDEFNKERDNVMDEMRKNNSGRGTTIKVSN